MLVSFGISQVIHTCTGCQAPVSRNKPFLKSSQDLMSVTARNLDSSFYFINCILQRLPYFILPYWPRSLPQSYPQPQLHYRCKNFGNVASLKANIFLGNYEGWGDGRRCSEKKNPFREKFQYHCKHYFKHSFTVHSETEYFTWKTPFFSSSNFSLPDSRKKKTLPTLTFSVCISTIFFPGPEVSKHVLDPELENM